MLKCGFVYKKERSYFFSLKFGKIWMVLLHRQILKILNSENMLNRGSQCFKWESCVLKKSERIWRGQKICWNTAFIDISIFSYFSFSRCKCCLKNWVQCSM